MASASVRSKTVILLWLINYCCESDPIVCEFCVESLFCYAVLCVLSGFAIVSMGNRESCLRYFCCLPDVMYSCSW